MPRRKRGFLGWLIGAPEPTPDTRLNAEAAVALAAQSPAVRALSWDLSRAVVRQEGNRLVWRVSTNHIGAQWWVEVDDATGAVSEVHYAHGR
jgi:hypothetical protein